MKNRVGVKSLPGRSTTKDEQSFAARLSLKGGNGSWTVRGALRGDDARKAGIRRVWAFAACRLGTVVQRERADAAGIHCPTRADERGGPAARCG